MKYSREGTKKWEQVKTANIQDDCKRKIFTKISINELYQGDIDHKKDNENFNIPLIVTKKSCNILLIVTENQMFSKNSHCIFADFI